VESNAAIVIKIKPACPRKGFAASARA